MKNSGKQLVGILVLLAIVLVVFFCVSNGGTGTSNFGALMQYKLTNKLSTNLNIVWIINNQSNYGASDNGSGPQKIVEIKVYSADGQDYWYFYYGGSTAYSISKDPTNPTLLRLNATGGKQRGSTDTNQYDWWDPALWDPAGTELARTKFNSGRYVRIFRSTKRSTDPPYAIALLIYVDGYGNLIDNNDKVSQMRGTTNQPGNVCGNCMPLDPGVSNENPPRYSIGLMTQDVTLFGWSTAQKKMICPFVSLPTDQSIPIINNIKEYRRVPRTLFPPNTIAADATSNITIKKDQYQIVNVTYS
jgi:hypothetical protein